MSERCPSQRRDFTGWQTDNVKGSEVSRPGRRDAAGSQGLAVPGALETIRPLMSPGTFVVPLMDGIEAPNQLAAAFGKERVVGGI
jgi:hypothetical protein